MGIGLKNSARLVQYVLPAVEFAVNEQCVQYSECARFAPFIDDGKPVFHIEYPEETTRSVAANYCRKDGAAEGTDGFSTVIKNLNLDGWVKYCDGDVETTPLS